MQYACWVSACTSDLLVSCGCLPSSAFPSRRTCFNSSIPEAALVLVGFPLWGCTNAMAPWPRPLGKVFPLHLFPRQGCTRVHSMFSLSQTRVKPLVAHAFSSWKSVGQAVWSCCLQRTPFGSSSQEEPWEAGGALVTAEWVGGWVLLLPACFTGRRKGLARVLSVAQPDVAFGSVNWRASMFVDRSNY